MHRLRRVQRERIIRDADLVNLKQRAIAFVSGRRPHYREAIAVEHIHRISQIRTAGGHIQQRHVHQAVLLGKGRI